MRPYEVIDADQHMARDCRCVVLEPVVVLHSLLPMARTVDFDQQQAPVRQVHG